MSLRRGALHRFRAAAGRGLLPLLAMPQADRPFLCRDQCRRRRSAVEGAEKITWYEASAFAKRGFCAICGSALFWKHNERRRDSVMAGAFDQPSGLKGEVPYLRRGQGRLLRRSTTACRSSSDRRRHQGRRRLNPATCVLWRHSELAKSVPTFRASCCKASPSGRFEGILHGTPDQGLAEFGARLPAACRCPKPPSSRRWSCSRSPFRLPGSCRPRGAATALLVGAVLLLIMVEVLNTGIEAACDAVSREFHIDIQLAKDCGSLAVLISVVLARSSGAWRSSRPFRGVPL